MSDTESPKVTAKSFGLLDGLANDNSKDWFDAYRDEVKAWLAKIALAIAPLIVFGQKAKT